MNNEETTTAQTTEAPTTTTSTTEAPTTTEATTAAPSTTQAPEPNNPDAEHAAPTSSNQAGNVASPGVNAPANDPTLNDVNQDPEERLAAARNDAMVNHAAANGGAGGEQSNTEEVVG